MSAPAPPVFVYGNCVFARGGDAWAMFALATHTYDLLGTEEKRLAFSRLLAAVEAVEADLQILRVSRAWDAGAYAASMGEAATPHPRSRDRYVAAQRRALTELDAGRTEVFAGVRLAAPRADVGALVSSAADRDPRTWWARMRAAAGLDRAGVAPAGRLEEARRLADQAHARLADFLDARPATTSELQWLVRRSFCRACGEPEVDELHEPQALVFERNGEAVLAPLEADVLRWTEGHVEIGGRHLRIESELGVSWQALLAAGALPERAEFPGRRLELMFAAPESLPFAVDMALNARYVPNGVAVRLARRRIQDADQIARAEADGDQGVSDRGYERTVHARDLLGHLQAAGSPPLLRATLSVAVAAPDPETLEERVDLCRRAFGEVRLHRPFGDQLALFLGHLPGVAGGLRGYETFLTGEQVAAMMPTAAHRVGSRRGFYLGHTAGGARHPVRLNLREGSDADRNAAILSVGALGTGKTTLEQKLKYEGFLLGARIVDCDPKGDHRLHLLDDVAPHAETVSLRPERSLRGLLDPLRVAPDHLRQDAAVSFLSELLPARSDAAWETAIVRAVDAVLAGSPRPGGTEVIRALAAGDEVDRQVARALEVHARSGLTQLGFADPEVALPEVGHRQVTYIPIRDLPRPEAGVARAEMSPAERGGEQIVRLIAMFAMHLMARERDRLKLFSFDEGWRLLSDPVGRLLLASLQRMGRSELAVPIISTQLISDVTGVERESLENLIGATFVFGMRSEAEARRALALLGLDGDDSRLRRHLLELDAGRCLMRDHHGRIESIQVDLAAPWLLRALSTTPAAP